jgi:hypothetical protein
MKRIHWIILSISLMAVAIFFAIFKISREEPVTKTAHAKYKFGSYYIPFEITEFNHQGVPCLPILIEDQTPLLALDLGSSGEVCLHKEILDQLRQKTFLRLRKSMGFRGNEYEKKVYNISKIQIGGVSFGHLLLDEESELFQKDSVIVGQTELVPMEKGRLGWRLFHNTNLFLDLGNSKIAICDSLETLSGHGYPADLFTKVPLLLDHNVIQIEAEKDSLPFFCYLDTGSTWNILNTQKEGVDWSVDAPATVGALQIHSKTFDGLVWHRLPICYPFRVDAILGMEFFRDHVVFLDFSKKIAYICKRQ